MNIGEKIRLERTKAGLTQAMLAQKAKVSEISIRKYESGDRKPKIDTIYKIADALCIPASEIAEVPPPPTITIEGKSFRTGQELEKYLEHCGERDILMNVYENFLNEKGQKKLCDYAIDLSNLDKYKKS